MTQMTAQSTSTGDKPVQGFSRFTIFLWAGVVIIFAYVFSLLSVLLLLALIGIELICFLVLARFGAARLISPALGRHTGLLLRFLNSFWLRKGVEYRITVEPTEAPELFQLIEALCHQAHVKPPHQVALELSTNAWVNLKGLLPGTGRTVLGIGYDLLAGLTKSEMEAVLAHEMMHAKLVQRGYKRWLNKGLGRTCQLAGILGQDVENAQRAGQSQLFAPLFHRLADAFARSGTEAVAACSRQDEFDADRGATQLCSSAALRTALLKLEGLERCANRLPLNERLARLHSGTGFSQWLVAQLAVDAQSPAAEAAGHYASKYSTHPALPDRLAALPPDATEPQLNTAPAISLLAQADALAARLITRIQEVLGEQERKDSKQLRRWTRKNATRTKLRPLQLFALAFFFIGFGAGLFFIFDGFSAAAGVTCAFFITVGILLYRAGWYEPKLQLPVPDFVRLKNAWQNPPEFTEDHAKLIETRLQAQYSATSGSSTKCLALAQEAANALGICDYGRAYVAARLSLRAKENSIEGVMTFLVAASGLGQGQQAYEALKFLQYHTGMRSGMVAWSAAWGCALIGDWATAEAYLEKAIEAMPSERTILLLQAICQSRRGKLQSAILCARNACLPQAISNEHSKVPHQSPARCRLPAGSSRSLAGIENRRAQRRGIDVRHGPLEFAPP
ncbi:MAG: M48 family metallopeptidase [Verrucomicrobiota bacterium]